jgi:hypothetical protein
MSGKLARILQVSRAEYMRLAIHRMNRKTAAKLRAERLAEISKRLRAESMNVNAEFASIERDPDAQAGRNLAREPRPAHGANSAIPARVAAARRDLIAP